MDKNNGTINFIQHYDGNHPFDNESDVVIMPCEGKMTFRNHNTTEVSD